MEILDLTSHAHSESLIKMLSK